MAEGRNSLSASAHSDWWTGSGRNIKHWKLQIRMRTRKALGFRGDSLGFFKLCCLKRKGGQQSSVPKFPPPWVILSHLIWKPRLYTDPTWGAGGEAPSRNLKPFDQDLLPRHIQITDFCQEIFLVALSFPKFLLMRSRAGFSWSGNAKCKKVTE